MPVCEICEGHNFKLIATKIREGEGRIMQCQDCDLVIQDLDWDAQKLRDYYEKEYQETNSLESNGEQQIDDHFNDRLKTINPIFENIKPMLSLDKTLLEVGCGAGELLYLIKPHVKKCVGIELNTPFIEYMKKKVGIEGYAEDVNKIDLGEKFDLVVLISTLDHLPNPLETLTTLKNLLNPGGKVYIEIPNRNEALNFFLPETNRLQFNQFFWHRAHLFYFTQDTIKKLFDKVGLNIEITCRHDYTLKNYLNWYYIGKPQPGLVVGMTEKGLFSGETHFETRMNTLFEKMESEFKTIMSDTFRGDSLCCTGTAKEN